MDIFRHADPRGFDLPVALFVALQRENKSKSAKSLTTYYTSSKMHTYHRWPRTWIIWRLFLCFELKRECVTSLSAKIKIVKSLFVTNFKSHWFKLPVHLPGSDNMSEDHHFWSYMFDRLFSFILFFFSLYFFRLVLCLVRCPCWWCQSAGTSASMEDQRKQEMV